MLLFCYSPSQTLFFNFFPWNLMAFCFYSDKFKERLIGGEATEAPTTVRGNLSHWFFLWLKLEDKLGVSFKKRETRHRKMQFLSLILWGSRIMPSIVWEREPWLWWLHKLVPDAYKEQSDQPMSPPPARLFRVRDESLQIPAYSQQLIGLEISAGLTAGKNCNDHKSWQFLTVLSNADHYGQ